MVQFRSSLDETKLNALRRQSKRRPLSFLEIYSLGEEKDFFVENLSMLLSSDMGILEALDTIRIESRSHLMQQIISGMKEDVDAGFPLWETLRRSGFLPESAISLIKIGEEAGRLPENLNLVAIQRAKERIFKSKLKSASIYPALVLFMTVAIGLGTAWFILPKFSSLFTNMNVKLPFLTRALMFVGQMFGKYGIIIVPAILSIFIAVFYLLFINKKTKHIGQEILFKIPGTHKIIQESELARMGYLLGTLFNAGVPIIDSIKSIVDSTSYKSYRDLYRFLAEKVEEGIPFSGCFKMYPNSHKLVPFSVQQMIVAADKSGTLAKTFSKIGNIYDEKAEMTTKNLEVIIEPVMLAIIFVGVLTVALAVIMPIYGLVGSMNEATNAAMSPP